MPADSDLPISKVLREYDRPEIRVERTEYGMRLQTLRRISDAQTHIRVTNILFPQAFVIPMNAEMTITQFHVPVDDTGCYWYSIFTSFGAPVDKDTMRAQRLKTYPAPDYKPIFIERTMAGASTPTSRSRRPSPAWASISTSTTSSPASRPGAIADRTKENLGTTDKGIVLYRRLLLDAIRKNEAGAAGGRHERSPPARRRSTASGPPPASTTTGRNADEKRRKQSKWAA